MFAIPRGKFQRDFYYELLGSVGSGWSGAVCQKTITKRRRPRLTFVTKTVSRPNDVFTKSLASKLTAVLLRWGNINNKLYNLTMVILVCAPNLNAVSVKKFTVGRLEKNKEY